MDSYENPDERVSVLELNSELQHAQLELLSAHCATHQLRLRYSADELARFGRRDVLRKSAQAASALSEFYAAVEKKFPQSTPGHAASAEPSREKIAMATGWVSSYLSAQREHYLPIATPLSDRRKASMRPYFSAALLDQIRIVELLGARVSVPDFYSQVRAEGFEPPEISHMDSLTFIDVVVFNERFSERALFHALVHSVQIQKLGLQRYAELWVSSFVKTRAHFTVPLEVHAFSLASKFLRPATEQFSVEDQVRLWEADARY
jgi:hypothetical protein